MILNINRFWELSISPFNEQELALISKSTGEFLPLDNKSKKLKKLKKELGCFLSCNKHFIFSHMGKEQKEQLINILK